MIDNNNIKARWMRQFSNSKTHIFHPCSTSKAMLSFLLAEVDGGHVALSNLCSSSLGECHAQKDDTPVKANIPFSEIFPPFPSLVLFT
jgi:hypothetical protein